MDAPVAPPPQPNLVNITNPPAAPPSLPPTPDGSGGFSKADIRRNMFAVVLLDSIFTTGWAELGLALGPLWVYLNASNKLIGAVQGATIFALFGMIVSPWISPRFPIKKYYLLAANVPYLLPIGLAGGVIILSHYYHLTNTQNLYSVVGLMFVHQFFAGFVALPHEEYVAACIPMSHRGRYTGLSGSTGSILAAASTSLGGLILYYVEKPMAFGYLLVMTWFICQSGYLAALLAKEQPVPPAKHRPWSLEMLKRVCRDDKYMRVLGLQSATQLTYASGMGFVGVWGFRELGMAPATAAISGLIWQVTRILTSAPGGWLIDRFSPKRVWPFSPLGAAVAMSIPLLIPNQWGVFIFAAAYAAFVLPANSAAGVLFYGIPKPEHRAQYYSIKLIVSYSVGAAGAVLTGSMFDLVSYRTGFFVLMLAGVVIAIAMKILLRPLSDNPADYA